ncbi:MAG: type II toxin-antitoxin system RelE/ParE family toxin [Desulfovibrionaceae bacterium]|nr:type II toxin-antitoxin system RelE/ParE family toxin [Desulfovibrionaceae bacterium]
MNEVRRYRTEDGREVVTEWLADLKDIRARARIAARIDRLAAGNFGDCKAIRDGVSEPRVDYGPGYRVYYGKLGKTILLLLCGGEKRSQDAGIERAAA